MMKTKNYLLLMMMIFFVFSGYSQDELSKQFDVSNLQPKLKDCDKDGYNIYDFEVSGIDPISKIYQITLQLDNQDDNNQLTELDVFIQSPSGIMVGVLSPFGINSDILPHKTKFNLAFRDCPDFPVGKIEQWGPSPTFFRTHSNNGFDAFDGEDIRGTWQIGICAYNNSNVALSNISVNFESEKPHIIKLTVTDATTCVSDDGSLKFNISSGRCNSPVNSRYKLNTETDWNVYVLGVDVPRYSNLSPGTYELTIAQAPDGVNVDETTKFTHNIVINGSSNVLEITCQPGQLVPQGTTLETIPPDYCGPAITKLEFVIKDPQGNSVGPFLYEGKPTSYTYTELGYYEVIWLVETANEIADCTQFIEVIMPDPCVNDVTAPVLDDCPKDFTKNFEVNETFAKPVYRIPISNDNCKVTTRRLTVNLTGGSTFSNGATQGIWTNQLDPGTTYNFQIHNEGVANFLYEAIDKTGNAVDCKTKITILDQNDPCDNDVTAPVFKVCPSDQAVILDVQNETTLVTKDLIVTDNCKVTFANLTISFTGGASFQDGTTELTHFLEGKVRKYEVKGKGVMNFKYKIKDAAGNEATCTFNIELLIKDGPCKDDIIAPKVNNCPQGEILHLVNGQVKIDIEVPAFLDDCAITDIKAIFTLSGGATNIDGSTKKVSTGLSAGSKGIITILGSGKLVIEYIAVDPTGNEGNCIVTHKIVTPGSSVLFDIATQCAAPNLNTNLPVTVSRFKSIGAFSFDLKVPNNSGLSFVGIENEALQNLSSNVLANGDLRISWDDPKGGDISLEDNHRIFDLVVRANNDFTKPVAISGKDVVILSSVNDIGIVSVTSICVGSSVTPSGKIQNTAGKVHKDVNVRLLSGGKTINTLKTNTQGNYGFNNTHATYRIEAHKNDQLLLGISIVDVAKIRRHFLQTNVLTNDYDIVAGDVNNDGKINVLDVAYTNRVLLRKRDNFPNNTSWRFLPAALDISKNPLDPNHPSSIKLNAANLDYTKLDFVSIKVGDVDHSALGKIREDKTNTRSAAQVSIPDTVVVSSDNITIPVYVSGKEKISLFSMTMKYDNKLLKLVGINSESIPSFSGGNFNDLDGEVLIAWDHPKGADFTGEGVLMTLVFEGKSMEGISDITMEDVMFFDKDFGTIDFNVVGGKVQLMPTAVSDISDDIKISASPNPFKDNININVLTNTAQNIKLTFSDLSGQVLKEVFSAQKNTNHHFNIDDINYRGVILVSVRGEDFIKSLKLVKL